MPISTACPQWASPLPERDSSLFCTFYPQLYFGPCGITVGTLWFQLCSPPNKDVRASSVQGR